MPFLYAGLGYGGSCFPKDVQALQATLKANGLDCDILNAVEKVNKKQRSHYVNKILSSFNNDVSGRTFAVWGLSFKPRTDDMREAPAVEIIQALVARGAKFKVFDPEAMANAKELLASVKDSVEFMTTQSEALDSADALLLVTEWGAFRSPDFSLMKKHMKGDFIFDGRNQYSRKAMQEFGFKYVAMGR